MGHTLVTDVAMCFSLCPSVTVRDHLECREQFINITLARFLYFATFASGGGGGGATPLAFGN